MRRAAMLTIGALSIFLSISAQAAPATERYVGGFADKTAMCGVNTACFSLEQSGASGLVLIHDTLGLPVGAHAVFLDGSTELARSAFCGGIELNGPAQATTLEIRIQEVPGCGSGTTGVVSFG